MPDFITSLAGLFMIKVVSIRMDLIKWFRILGIKGIYFKLNCDKKFRAIIKTQYYLN